MLGKILCNCFGRYKLALTADKLMIDSTVVIYER